MNCAFTTIVIILACSAWTTGVQNCAELSKDLVGGKVVSVECCQTAALLKVDGRVTAEKSLKEARCPEREPEMAENPTMQGWQITISISLVVALIVVTVLVGRAVYRLYQ